MRMRKKRSVSSSSPSRLRQATAEQTFRAKLSEERRENDFGGLSRLGKARTIGGGREERRRRRAVAKGKERRESEKEGGVIVDLIFRAPRFFPRKVFLFVVVRSAHESRGYSDVFAWAILPFLFFIRGKFLLNQAYSQEIPGLFKLQRPTKAICFLT